MRQHVFFRGILGAAFLIAAFSSLVNTSDAASGKFRVAVDVGHSRLDQGAESARGVGEYTFNLAVAQALLVELSKDRRIEAILINPSGASISLQERAETINRAGARLIISIHHDSVQPHYLSSWTHDGMLRTFCDLFQGFSIFISDKNPQVPASRLFAVNLGEALLSQGFHPTNHHMEQIEGEARAPVDTSRGVYWYDNLVVLKKTNAPAVLLECGIIKNRVEELVLASPSTQKNLAVAIRKAIQESLRDLRHPHSPSSRKRPSAG